MLGSLRQQATFLDTGFFAALRRYGQVMFALLQREQEHRRQSPIESLADVLEPLLFVSIMGILWNFLNRRASSPLGDNSLLFIATGFYAKFFWISLSKFSRGARGGASHRFPVERRLDYIFVHLMLTTGEYLLLALVGFGILYCFFTSGAIPFNFIPVIEAMLAIICLGFGWGMITQVLTRYFWPWAYLSSLFNRALILFSGIFFLIEFLPPGPRQVMSYNPMFHAIALFRTGFYPNYPTLVLDTRYLFYCAVGAVFIGIVLERVTLRFER
jgi:capsular polysaccharide transport system permease protein